MNLKEALEEWVAIKERIETEEDLRRELKRVSADDKQKLLYAGELTNFLAKVRGNAIWFIDFCEDNEIVNNYVGGVSESERILGMLKSLTLMLSQVNANQARAEMQVLNSASQFGMQLSERMSELSEELKDIAEELTMVQSHYAAVMAGRRGQIHYINDEADWEPYSEQELEAVRFNEESRRNAFYAEIAEFDKWLEQDRKENPRISGGIPEVETVKQLELAL